MTPRRPSPFPPVLSVEGVLLDTRSRELTGPTGTVALIAGSYVVLRELLLQSGTLVPTPRLIEALWPDADQEPSEAALAVHRRVDRARHALDQAGIRGDRIKATWKEGYTFTGEPQVVRTYTPAGAELLDRLVRTHHDAALVTAFLTGRGLTATIGATA